MQDGQVVLNHEENEFDLFTKPLVQGACGGCKASACLGGCPAEEVVMGASYASTILTGQYRHVLFGDPDLDERVDPASLTPVMVRWEQSGSSYVLHHTMVHAVVAEPYTVSLVIRGPAVKDRFLVMDRGTGHSWWQYGAVRGRPGIRKGCRRDADVRRAGG
ncbi:MAG: hypothetical protein JWM19_3871 [Actinomycetia bacterium]|nr:hypothetical protein [Actinomycetes bacterium]